MDTSIDTHADTVQRSYLSHVAAGICEHLIRKGSCIRARRLFRRLCWRCVCRSHPGALLAVRFLLHMAETSGSENACNKSDR